MAEFEIEQQNVSAKSSSLWRNRDYMLLWSGQVISTLGTEASSVVYPLLILALTNSPAAAGVAGALSTIPYLLLGLPAGVFIDRWDRKRTMILCDIGRGIAVASIAFAILFDVLTLWHIYLVALVDGSLVVLFNIAEMAAISRVVPKEQLPQATGQNEAAFGFVSIAGPSVGTFLYALGQSAPFLFDSISYTVSVVSLGYIKTPFQNQRVITTRNLRREMAEGLRWLWNEPIVRFLAMMAGGLNFAAASAPLIVIVIAKKLGAVDSQIGLIFSIAGVGGIIGSLVGGQVQKRFTFGQVVTFVAWGITLMFASYAIVPRFLLLGVASAVSSFLITNYNVVSISYRLALIPEELQGRVNSSFRFIAFAFRPLGMAVSGFLLDRFGNIPTIIVFSLWLAALAIMTAFNPHIHKARILKNKME